VEDEKLILLFPVPVFRYRDIGVDNEALLQEMRAQGFFRNRSPDNYTSEQFRLQDNPRFKPLTDAIVERAHHIFGHHFAYQYEDLCINSMWCNVHKPDPTSAHHFHEHSNSFFSGTYYAEVNDERSPIVFETPHRVKAIAPELRETNRLNMTRAVIPITTGDLLMWPSDLRHGILPYEGAKRRVSISFNVMFKGLLGGPTWQHRY